jgi:phosphatidylglycerophosphate synthase
MLEKFLTLANWVTLIRLGLVIWFGWCLLNGNEWLAATVFVMAWGLDAVDGWLARTRGEETRFGYWFDKIVDRLLLAGGLVMALAVGAVPSYAIWLAMKDIAVLPVITIKLQQKRNDFGMGFLGKMMTMFQGIGFLWVMIGLPGEIVVVGLVAGLGAIVSGRYLFQITYGEK